MNKNSQQPRQHNPLVLEANAGNTGSPEVRYTLEGPESDPCRNGVRMTLAEVEEALRIMGPVGHWLATEAGFQRGVPSYCTQNDGDCRSCSLKNYGRDCQNNPLAKVTP